MSSNKLSLVTARPNRSTSTKMDTLEVSPEAVKAWRKPPFQRPLKVNEMGEEFVILNSAISRIGPDDILRGLKEGNPALQKILSQLPFVGFDMIRRGAASPVVSMIAVAGRWP